MKPLTPVSILLAAITMFVLWLATTSYRANRATNNGFTNEPSKEMGK